MNITKIESGVMDADGELVLNPKCSLHPEDELFSFCDDCKTVLCDKCSIHHKNHTFRKEITDDIIAFEKNAVLNESLYRSQKDDLCRSMERLEGSKKVTENQIELFLQKILERTKNQKAALQELFVLQMPILKKREKLVSEILQCAKYMKMVARKTMFNCVEINPFAAYEKLQEKRKEFEKFEEDLQQNCVKDFYFTFKPSDPDSLYVGKVTKSTRCPFSYVEMRKTKSQDLSNYESAAKYEGIVSEEDSSSDEGNEENRYSKGKESKEQQSPPELKPPPIPPKDYKRNPAHIIPPPRRKPPDVPRVEIKNCTDAEGVKDIDPCLFEDEEKRQTECHALVHRPMSLIYREIPILTEKEDSDEDSSQDSTSYEFYGITSRDILKEETTPKEYMDREITPEKMFVERTLPKNIVDEKTTPKEIMDEIITSEKISYDMYTSEETSVNSKVGQSLDFDTLLSGKDVQEDSRTSNPVSKFLEDILQDQMEEPLPADTISGSSKNNEGSTLDYDIQSYSSWSEYGDCTKYTDHNDPYRAQRMELNTKTTDSSYYQYGDQSLKMNVTGGTSLSNSTLLLCSFIDGIIRIFDIEKNSRIDIPVPGAYDAATTEHDHTFAFVSIFPANENGTENGCIKIVAANGADEGIFSSEVNKPLGLTCSKGELFVCDSSIPGIKIFCVVRRILKRVIKNPEFVYPLFVCTQRGNDLIVSENSGSFLRVCNETIIYRYNAKSNEENLNPGKCASISEKVFCPEQHRRCIFKLGSKGELQKIKAYDKIPYLILNNPDENDQFYVVFTDGQVESRRIKKAWSFRT